jgi:hypothetical protein
VAVGEGSHWRILMEHAVILLVVGNGSIEVIGWWPVSFDSIVNNLMNRYSDRVCMCVHGCVCYVTITHD